MLIQRQERTELYNRRFRRSQFYIKPKDFYPMYLNTSSDVDKIKDFEVYKKVLMLFNRAMFKYILLTGNRFRMPYGLGNMLFMKIDTIVEVDSNGNLDKVRSKLLINRSETYKLWASDKKAKAEGKYVYYNRDSFASFRWLKGKFTNRKFYYFDYDSYCTYLIKDIIENNLDLLDLYELKNYNTKPIEGKDIIDHVYNDKLDLKDGSNFTSRIINKLRLLDNIVRKSSI